MPKRVLEEMNGAQAHWRTKRRSIFVDIIDQELMMQERIVVRERHDARLLPLRQQLPLRDRTSSPSASARTSAAIQPEEMRGLAEAVKTCLLKWQGALGETPYNFLIHTAPNDTELSGVHEDYPFLDAYYCWHLEMFPRLTKTAGFEWGTGFYINPIPPEEAAEYLRGVEVEVR